MQTIAAASKFHSVTACLLFAFLSPAAHSTAVAQDNFEGAVWKFEMSNKKDPGEKLVGRFRVSNHVLYQKDTPADPKYSKRVGTNHPGGKKTRFEVRDFRAFTQEGKRQLRMEGTARMTMLRIGEWEGLFTDKSGANWDLRASRIEE